MTRHWIVVAAATVTALLLASSGFFNQALGDPIADYKVVKVALQKVETGLLKLGNIKGKAQTKGFEDQIVFESMAYRISQAGEWDPANRPSQMAQFGDLKLVKLMDVASPSLTLACASKEQFPRADIALVSGTVVYLHIILEGVIVSSATVEFQAGDPRPVETITLKYQKATWEWGTAKASYDLLQNLKS